MLLEEGFLLDGFSSVLPPGYQHCLSREDALSALTSYGDELLEEVVVPRASVAAFNKESLDLIRNRAEELATRNPKVAEGVRAFVREQEVWRAAAEVPARRQSRTGVSHLAYLRFRPETMSK